MTASIEHATNYVDRLTAFDPALLPRTGPEKFTLLAVHARAEAAVVQARAAEITALVAVLGRGVNESPLYLSPSEHDAISARVLSLLGIAPAEPLVQEPTA